MTKHRSHSAAFKRQVAQEFIAGETLHGLSKRHTAEHFADLDCRAYAHQRRR